jgi:hypothetical protein
LLLATSVRFGFILSLFGFIPVQLTRSSPYASRMSLYPGSPWSRPLCIFKAARSRREKSKVPNKCSKLIRKGTMSIYKRNGSNMYIHVDNNSTLSLRRLWRYQRGNQNPYIGGEQTTQWPKYKALKNKQRSTKHTHTTKDRVTRTTLKTGGSGSPEE